jgi:hypothetical protein
MKAHEPQPMAESDPVCGMRVDLRSAAASGQHEGQGSVKRADAANARRSGIARFGNGELVARRNSDAAGRMDLLTAVMHEMRHLLGLDQDHHGLMDDELPAGVRRNPDDDVAQALAIE